MIPNIPTQRKFKAVVGKPFDALIAYIEGGKEQQQGIGLEKQPGQQRIELSSKFDDILNYATSPLDKNENIEKCIAIRTHGVKSIATASSEMNAVSLKNTRCKDPAYHFILSWPEHEKPSSNAIFEAAEHAIKALGLAEHQYVLAIHGDTDNIHCHISVNRIHPITFQSRHIEWAVKTLHMAARQSEIKHGWTHDNGIYIVEIDGHGKKHIVLNKENSSAISNVTAHAHSDLGKDELLPTWHDPESLESWLKTKVARALKHALHDLDGWPALHAWLSKYDITLKDSGGGGMRLHAISPETGEILDIAASKGLRNLKRSDLEKSWGNFANSVQVPCIVPDLSHLTLGQIAKGIEDVLNRNPDHERPPEHVIRAQQHTDRDATERSRGLHELSTSGMDGAGQDSRVPLPNALQDRLGNNQAGENQDLRRAGASSTRGSSERSLNRDNSKREERKQQRSEARVDLRQRFSQYMRFVRTGDSEHVLRAKSLQSERRQALKQISEKSKAAKSAITKAINLEARLVTFVEIDAESLRRKLEAEAIFQTRCRSLRATRTPPLSWRAWLYEQSNLGDKAALSALRGIVYQVQRDSKGDIEKDAAETEVDVDTEEYRDRQYKKVMARLLEEEKKELAIRSANSNAIRPYEADVLLAQYIGIQWRVTGNGNVEYRNQSEDHLFTDRGNRVTFDRVRVSDNEIRLALVHAQQKFGQQLTLTGDDTVFTERMARLADDMGMTILNPELKTIIATHRTARTLKIAQAITISPSDKLAPVSDTPRSDPDFLEKRDTGDLKVPSKSNIPTQQDTATSAVKTLQDRLRDIVLSIDPLAKFVIPDTTDSKKLYVGLIAAQLGDSESGFAQHIGRSVYALHDLDVPKHQNNVVIELQYLSKSVKIKIQDNGKERG